MRRILKVAAFIMSAAFIMLIFACPQKAEPKEPGQFYVVFNKNGANATGEMELQSFTEGLSQTLDLNGFENYGYHFTGWATWPGGKKVYDNGESIVITSHITLYAVWEANKYTVTFDSNGGAGTMEPQVFTHYEAQNIIPNDFSLTDYAFTGWATSEDGAKNYNDEETISITSDMTLYAVWKSNLSSITATRVYTGEYIVGDTISAEDITVEATYVDGSKEVVTSWTTDETFEVPASDKEITISYTEYGITKTTSLKITIGDNYTIAYSFTDTATVLDGHDGTAGTSWTYVQFGDWPQTIKAEAVRILERQKLETGLFTYYAGSDGKWYVKQAEKAYSTGDAYKYSDGTQAEQASAGTSKYFKVEPIKWRVLEEKDGRKFLLAENCLMALPYYDTAGGTRTIGGSTIYANNYMHSKIRAWLNGYIYKKETADCADYQNKGFLQTAFTSVAQAKIATTTVDNSVESTLDSENECVCEDTDDKVFLLSRKEVTTASYGFSRSAAAHYRRVRRPTDFALATGAEKTSDSMYNSGPWLLRSPDDYNRSFASYIYYDGNVYYKRSVSRDGGAVVPALWVTP